MDTLSGKPTPQHCRDSKAAAGAYSALDRWSNWGYTILGLSDKSAIVKGKSFGDAVEELRYALYCFPTLEAIYFDPGFSLEIYRLDAASYSEIGVEESHSFLTGAIASISRQYRIADPAKIWVASDLAKDEEAASGLGVNFLSADIWRVQTDGINMSQQPLIFFESF